MTMAHYHSGALAATPVRRRTQRRHVKALAVHPDLADLEFSDIGRDPHYASGWFIAPAILVFVLMIAVLL
jgi:hypothetical protein